MYRACFCQCRQTSLQNLSFTVDKAKVSELLEQRRYLGIKPFYFLCLEVRCLSCGFNLKNHNQAMLGDTKEIETEFQSQVVLLFEASVSKSRRV